MSGVSLALLVAMLSEAPSPAALEAAQRADLAAGWAASEAQRARAQKLKEIAEAYDRRARAHRQEALRALGLR